MQQYHHGPISVPYRLVVAVIRPFNVCKIADFVDECGISRNQKSRKRTERTQNNDMTIQSNSWAKKFTKSVISASG